MLIFNYILQNKQTDYTVWIDKQSYSIPINISIIQHMRQVYVLYIDYNI
jgi:hypothetical protein